MRHGGIHTQKNHIILYESDRLTVHSAIQGSPRRPPLHPTRFSIILRGWEWWGRYGGGKKCDFWTGSGGGRRPVPLLPTRPFTPSPGREMFGGPNPPAGAFYSVERGGRKAQPPLLPTPPFAPPPPLPSGFGLCSLFTANFDRPQRHPRLTPPPPTSPNFLSAHSQWLGALGSVWGSGTAVFIPN